MGEVLEGPAETAELSQESVATGENDGWLHSYPGGSVAHAHRCDLPVGASPADVLSLVLRESLAITAVGLTIGLGLAMLPAGA
jgi:hypothetical protein